MTILGAALEYVCTDGVIAAGRVNATIGRRQAFYIRPDGSLESGVQWLNSGERRLVPR